MKRFELEMQVRDYECDVQGIVNNAVYQNYLEHARHEFLHAVGCDFHALRAEGCAVVAAVETGVLARERYDHYVRLMSEAARFSAGMVEKREQDRRLARFRRTLQEGRSKPEELE